MKPLKQILLALVLTCVFVLGAGTPGNSEVLEKSDHWKSFVVHLWLGAGVYRGCQD